MRKFIIAGCAGLFTLVGIVGLAQAAPGPNGNNNHGMCTAYFNGSSTGQSHKHDAPPFVALESTASSTDTNSEAIESQVWDWCNNTTNNPKGIGGNPTDPNS